MMPGGLLPPKEVIGPASSREPPKAPRNQRFLATKSSSQTRLLATKSSSQPRLLATEAPRNQGSRNQGSSQPQLPVLVANLPPRSSSPRCKQLMTVQLITWSCAHKTAAAAFHLATIIGLTSALPRANAARQRLCVEARVSGLLTMLHHVRPCDGSRCLWHSYRLLSGLDGCLVDSDMTIGADIHISQQARRRVPSSSR